VRKGDSNKCSIVAGKWEDKPIGATGGAPYASKDYAKAALKTFPECKGGEAAMPARTMMTPTLPGC
jgi:hypothetical protein